MQKQQTPPPDGFGLWFLLWAGISLGFGLLAIGFDYLTRWPGTYTWGQKMFASSIIFVLFGGGQIVSSLIRKRKFPWN